MKCDMKNIMKNWKFAVKSRNYKDQLDAKQKTINQLKAQLLNSKKSQNISDRYTPSSSPTHSPYDKSKAVSISLISEMISNAKVVPSQRRFSKFFKVFAMGLLLISYPAYRYLRAVIPLPSRQLLMTSYQNLLSFEYEAITNLSCLNEITRNYRKKKILQQQRE